MFPNLEAELARAGVTKKRLGEVLGYVPSTMTLKLSEKAPLTLNDAKSIKDYLEVDIPLEVLFESNKGKQR